MEPTAILEKESIMLAGFSFYGDPFIAKDPWQEENEIGRLWQRFLGFFQTHAPVMKEIVDQSGVFFEVHLTHPATETTGEFEVFVGAPILHADNVPVELVCKVLPATRYAIFTLEGEEIAGDWHLAIYQEWMPQAGYTPSYPFSIQYYDERFKGLDNLAASSLDIYVPIRHESTQ